MSDRVYVVFYGGSDSWYGTSVSLASLSPVCHVGLVFDVTIPTTIKGITYPPGTYVYHAYDGVIIEPESTIQISYDRVYKMQIRHYRDTQMSTLMELIDSTYGTKYGLSQILNPVRWEGGATTDSGIMCVSLVQMYLNMLGYDYVMQTISPALLKSLMEKRRHAKVISTTVRNGNAYQTRMVGLLLLIVSSIALLYAFWRLGKNIIMSHSRKPRLWQSQSYTL